MKIKRKHVERIMRIGVLWVTLNRYQNYRKMILTRYENRSELIIFIPSQHGTLHPNFRWLGSTSPLPRPDLVEPQHL